MRLLHIGFCSNPPNSAGCAQSNLEVHWLRKILDDDPNARVISYQPSTFKIQGLWDHPRLEIRTYALRYYGQREETGYLPAEVMLDITRVDREYDAVFLAKPRVFDCVRGAFLNSSSGLSETIPVYVSSGYTMEKTGRLSDMSDFAEASQVSGWINSDAVIFWNRFQYSIAKRVASKHVPASCVERLTKNLMRECFTGGLSVKRLDKVGRKQSRENFRMSYAHRLSSHYGFAELCDLAKFMKMSGEPVTLVITCPQVSGGFSGAVFGSDLSRDKHDVESHFALPQMEYFEKAATCHVFVEKIDFAEACSGMLEQLYLGQIGIFPEKLEVIRPYLPKDYPYLYSSVPECEAMLLHVRKTYWTDECQALIKRVRDGLRNDADVRHSAVALSDRIRGDYEAQLTTISTSLIDLAESVIQHLNEPESITVEEYSKAVAAVARGGLRMRTKGLIMGSIGLGHGYSYRHFLQAMPLCGYVDDATSPVPVFRKTPDRNKIKP